nr:right-handed parallel beta-helix repeat-containing protein [Alphaproteobacteria bacterium]
GLFKDITVNTTGLRGFEVTNSDGIKLEDVWVNNTGQGAMAMLRDGIVFSSSTNARLKKVSVSTTGTNAVLASNGILFEAGSTGAQIDGAIIQATGNAGLVFRNNSGTATAKNITIVNAGGPGIAIFASGSVLIEDAVVDQTAMTAGRGVFVDSSADVTLQRLELRGRNTQGGVVVNNAANITIKDTKTSGWLTAYTLTGMATTILASTGNTSTNDMATCDSMNDIAGASPKLSVTRITGMMTSNVNCD